MMKFKLPDGAVRDLEWDFGYGYSVRSAEYMFTEGNYSCDCNRSMFLDIGEWECGHTIEMTEFRTEERD